MVNIDMIINEVKPKKDARILIKSLKPLSPFRNSTKENIKIFLLRSYSLVKPLIRGGGSGAGIGALASLISGGNAGTGAIYGGVIGATIDSAHYYPRLIYHGMKNILKQYSSSNLE